MPFNTVLGSLRNADILLNISHILTFQPFDIIAADDRNAHPSVCELVLYVYIAFIILPMTISQHLRRMTDFSTSPVTNRYVERSYFVKI